MEEGSRRGIYGERIPLCRGGVVWQLQELFEEAVGVFFFLGERGKLRKGEKNQMRESESWKVSFWGA